VSAGLDRHDIKKAVQANFAKDGKSLATPEIYTTKDVTNPNYGINYWVEKEKGKWTIFSENTIDPNKWSKYNEFESGFASKEDAVLVAKGMAGEEEDPEAAFMLRGR
jgi:hypothetical protein